MLETYRTWETPPSQFHLTRTTSYGTGAFVDSYNAEEIKSSPGEESGEVRAS